MQPEWRWHALWPLLRALRAVWKVPLLPESYPVPEGIAEAYHAMREKYSRARVRIQGRGRKAAPRPSTSTGPLALMDVADPAALPQQRLLAIEDIPREVGAVVAVNAPKRRRVGPRAAGDVPPWQPGEFTPADAIVDGTKCLARVWGNGLGGQCRKRPLPDLDVCKTHRGEQTHGKVTGPVPLAKLREFRKAAAAAAGATAEAAPEQEVQPVAVDFF